MQSGPAGCWTSPSRLTASRRTEPGKQGLGPTGPPSCFELHSCLDRTESCADRRRRPGPYLNRPRARGRRSAACRWLRRSGEGSRTTATPGLPPAARPPTGSCRDAGQAPPVSASPPHGREPAPRSAHLVDARVFLPELRVFHEARLQILQLRHVITCLIRSRAVASARRGVLRDFFVKTCSTTTRRPTAVT